MATDTDLRTCSVGYCSLAVVVQLLGNITEKCTTANCGLPGGLIHGKLLEVLEVHDDCPIFTSET